MTDVAHDRALAALTGVAVGDALGMPSQTLDREIILQAYGRITDFVAPVAGHPVSAGLLAAQVTDDTEQTLLLAKRLIQDGARFDEAAWAADLLRWERDIQARGLLDLLGPSTKAALAGLQSGLSPTETGKDGITNGAAMRIAPVGIATLPDPVRMVARVAQVSRLTHGRGEAIAGAVAVAMVISQGLEGQEFESALPLALEAAALPPEQGDRLAHQRAADQIRRALDVAARGADALATEIGTSVHSLQSVPCAFGIVRLADGDPWRAAVIAANIGDDTDTIGAISCGMAAACTGMAGLPRRKWRSSMPPMTWTLRLWSRVSWRNGCLVHDAAGAAFRCPSWITSIGSRQFQPPAPKPASTVLV